MELEELNQPSVEQIFDRIDTDNDGYVTWSEMLCYIRENVHVHHRLSKRLVKEVYRQADKDLDKRLNFEEFFKLSQDPEIQKIVSYMKRGVNGYINFMVPKCKCTRIDNVEVDGAYEDQYTCCPPAIIMILITLTEIAIFCYDAYTENGSMYGDGPIGKHMIFDPWRRKECWRFLSYMFVHIGSVHLLVNCAVQVLLGVPLEMVNRGGRVTLVYVAGVIAGSLGTSILEPNVKLAGASGGVYSLLTAHVATIIMNWKEMSYPLVQLLLWIILIATDVGNVVYTKFYLMNESDVSYTAHYFGATAGLLVGITVLRNIQVTKCERILRLIAISIYTVLMAGAILCNIFLPNHFPTQQV